MTTIPARTNCAAGEDARCFSFLPRWLLAAYTLLVLAVVAGGGWFYHDQRQSSRARAELDLQAIAQLKAEEIAAWRKERLADAAMLAGHSLFHDAAVQWLAAPEPEGAQRLLDSCRSWQASHQYRDLALVDADGRIRLSLSGRSGAVPTNVLRAVATAWRDRQPALTDLHVENAPPAHLDVIAPLLADGDRPVGAVLLCHEAAQFLHPLLASWPVPRQSAETLLVCREGDAVLFLNELRHRTNTALTLRLPLTQTNVPAVMAVLGRTGIVSGLDYRGVPVLSALQPIPDSPWFLVAKVDEAEALATWRRRGPMILALIGIAFLLASSAALMFWQRHEKRHFRTLYQAEAARLRLEERHQITLRSIGDAVVVVDDAGRVELLNPVAETLTGWPQAEAQGRPLAEVFRLIHEDTRQPVASPVEEVLRDGRVVGLANHTLLISKDGTERPIVDCGAPIRDAAGRITGVVLVFRDQTVERQARYDLQTSETRYRRLFEASKDGVLILDAGNGQIMDANPFLTDLLGCSVQQMLGKKVWEVAPFKDVAASEGRFQELREQGRVRHENLPLESADGRRVDVEFISHVYQVDHQPIIQCHFRDITARRRAEAAEREINAEFAMALEVGHAGVWEWDVQSDRVHFDDRFHAMLGYAPGELPNTLPAWLPYHHPADIPIWMPKAQAYLRGESPIYESEHRIRDQAGLWTWVFTRGKVVKRTPEGAPERFVGIAMNITTRKQAEAALRESEEHFRAMFEQAAIGMAQTDPATGQCLRVNRKLCEITGYTAAELLQMRITGLAHPDDQERDWEAYQREVRGETPDRRTEKRYLRKNGTLAWVSFNLTVIRDAAGQPTWTICTMADITARREAEAGQTRLATAMEQAAETVVITDLDALILYVNPAFEKISGYTRAEVLGRNPRLLKSGRHDAEFYRQMWATLRRGEVWRGRLINQRKDGALFEESATISPVLDAAGQVVNYIALKLDVTRASQLESQLQQAQKLEVIGRLAGGVAHDFNNILTAIFIQASLCGTEEALPAEARSSLADIKQAAERAANLTRQLLLFSRQQALQPRVLDLNTVVGDLNRMLRRILGEAVHLRLHLCAQPLRTLADAGMLDQVLLNLAVNARDAMPGGGQLTLETGHREVAAAQPRPHPDAEPGRYVWLRVSDTGSGIAPEVLPHIFEPFFTTKEIGRGTGLGLATVFGIVKQHRGWIEVQSAPAQGTVFQVHFPATTAAPAASPVAPARSVARPAARGGTETILLVEDEPVVRLAIRVFLERQGYRVLDAVHGLAALSLAQAHGRDIALLLTDLVIPEGLDGRKLAAQLQGQIPALKVVFMSGHSPELTGCELPCRPQERFLQKPFSPQRLLETLRDCLES